MIGKKWIVGFLAVILAGVGQIDAAVVQWTTGSGANGHWYEPVVVSSSGISWSDARDAAYARGGYLATVTSNQENDFVYSLISDQNIYWTPWGVRGIGPWLGGTDEQVEGQWRWITGEAWTYQNWAPQEPNHQPGEHYLQYYWYLTSTAKTWNDAIKENPGIPIISYVVEYNTTPVPEPTAFILWAGLGVMGLVAVRRKHEQ